MPKQLMNVVGAFVILLVLVGGVLLGGLPLYLESLATSSQTAAVAQTNAGYQAQVDQLTTAKKRIKDITADVDTLHTQVTPTTRADDVFELVAQAAAASGVTIVRVTASDPVPWSAVGGTLDEGAADAGAAEDAAAADATSGGTAETTAPPAAPTASPQLEVPFSITVSATDPAQTVAFIDQLGAGPRLIGIVSATLTRPNETYQLDVSVLAFVRTEA